MSSRTLNSTQLNSAWSQGNVLGLEPVPGALVVGFSALVTTLSLSSLPGQISLDAILGFVLPRCQLLICCGAGVQLSCLYWMTNILISGTYRCTLI